MIPPNLNIAIIRRCWIVGVFISCAFVGLFTTPALGNSKPFSVVTAFVPSADTLKLDFFFPLNVGLFNPDFGENQHQIERLDELFQHGVTISPSTHIVILVSASPEGPMAYNKRLIDQRMKSIYLFLKSRYPRLIYSKLSLKELAINWNTIAEQIVEESSFPLKAKTLAIISADWSAQKKEATLRALGNGVVFQRLKQGYLPSYRKAEMMLTNQKKVPSPATPFSAPVYRADSLIKDNTSLSLVRPTLKDTSSSLSGTPPRYYSQYPSITVKTNLLLDAFLMPNVAVEIPLGKKISFNAEWIFPWWSIPSKHYYYQMLAGNIEARYWFKPRTDYRGYMNGWFAGIFGGTGSYDFELGDTGYQGDSYMVAGLTAGYVHRIGRTLGMEYSLGFGYLKSKYREYDVVDNCYYWKSDGDFRWAGPLKANVTLIWTPRFLVSKKRMK